MWQAMVGMEHDPYFVRVRLGPQGRVVVPAHARRALGIDAGDVLIVSIEAGRLVIEPQDAALERLVARFDDVPREPDLVAELLAERREAARREALDDDASS